LRPGIRLARKKKADDTGNPASPSGRPHGHPLGDIGSLDQNVEAGLALDGAALVDLSWRSTRTRHDGRSDCHVTDMRFRAVTE
jgi:hypothetical protein